MDIARIVKAGAVAFVVMFGLGFVGHTVLLADQIAPPFGSPGYRAEPLLPAIAAAYLIAALVAAYFYPRVAEADATTTANGVRIGVLMVLTWFLPQALFLVGITETTLTHALTDVAWHLVVEQSLGGIALAYAYEAFGRA